MATKKEKKAEARKKAAALAKAKLAPVSKRIRMLINCANQHRAFSVGDILLVPEEIPVKTAKSWIKSGAAEEDKSLPDPPETK